jgi:hypothetical protein
MKPCSFQENQTVHHCTGNRVSICSFSNPIVARWFYLFRVISPFYPISCMHKMQEEDWSSMSDWCTRAHFLEH